MKIYLINKCPGRSCRTMCAAQAKNPFALIIQAVCLAGMTALITLACGAARAQSTIHATDAFSYGANVGWMSWRGEVDHGVVMEQYFCHGLAHGANIGWINFGDGSPLNGHAYSNQSGGDCGVNVAGFSSTGTTLEGWLRGLAYGANVGWLVFESQGDPRVDLVTGRLRGFVWGANIGWISLEGFTQSVTTTRVAAGLDSDADGIPDAWEFLVAGHLGLGGTETADADGDGMTDRAEYLADTAPLDPAERLQIVSFTAPRVLTSGGPLITDLAWTSRPTRLYAVETNPDLLSAWTVTADNIVPATLSPTTLQFSEPPAQRRFYRVRVKLPLAP